MSVGELKGLLMQSIELQYDALDKNGGAKKSLEETAGLMQELSDPSNFYTKFVVEAADKVQRARDSYIDADRMAGFAYRIVADKVKPYKFVQFFEVGHIILAGYGSLRMLAGDIGVAVASLHRLADVRGGGTIESIIRDVDALMIATDEFGGVAAQLIPITQEIHDTI